LRKKAGCHDSALGYRVRCSVLRGDARTFIALDSGGGLPTRIARWLSRAAHRVEFGVDLLKVVAV
jgi:hypothetical protein